VIVDMTTEELAEFHLSWKPASVVFHNCTDETPVLVYGDQHPVGGIYLDDLALALEEGVSQDEVILLLHEMVDQIEEEQAQAQRWRERIRSKQGGTVSGTSFTT